MFKYDLQDGNLQLLWSFANSNYGYPMADLTVYNGKLFGTTAGNNSYVAGAQAGTVFSIDPDGTDYTVLHDFPDGSLGFDGAYPLGGVTLAGDSLYGLTDGSNSGLSGAIYGIEPDGSAYEVLNVLPSRYYPRDDFLVKSDGSKMYATTDWAGVLWGNGNLIAVNLNEAFTVVTFHSEDEGEVPEPSTLLLLLPLAGLGMWRRMRRVTLQPPGVIW